MKRIGFNRNQEFLPSFDKFHSQVNQRVMFLKLFNQEVSCSLRFTSSDFKACRKETLFSIFVKKVFSYIQHENRPTKSFTLDVDKTIKINKFIKKVNSEKITKTNVFTFSNKKQTNLKTALMLIDIFEVGDCSFYLDGEKIFKNFVSNKIIKNNDSKKIDVNNDSIDIESVENSFRTKIFTFWDFINSKDLKIDKHIKKAVDCINTSTFKQIYLVYPKNENFNKHISVRTEGILSDEYEIKLIPYSLRSTLR